MNDIKVSIVVPVYNVEQYLDRCLKSLTNQTLKDIEIILVDDKSTDKSPSLCDEWRKKDERISVIHKQENQGLGEARNSGLEIAKGDYVAFVDSDDFVDLEAYKKLYELAKKEELDAIYTEFNIDNYPSYNITPYPPTTFYGRENVDKFQLDVLGALPMYSSDIVFQYSSCKAMYSNTLIKMHELFFYSERTCVSEDLIWNLQFLSKAKKVKVTNLRFYHYCSNGASLTHTYKPNLWERYLKLVELIQYSTKNLQNKSDYRVRLDRTILFYLRACLNQEKRTTKNYSQKIDYFNKLINEKLIREISLRYPLQSLPIKHRLFLFLVKYNLTCFLYLLSGR